MTIYELKPHFQRLLRPCSDRLVTRGIRPNTITLLALGLSVGLGSLLLVAGASYPLLFGLLPFFLLLRMGLNAVDGMMAKEHGLCSPLGALLNEVGDGVSDAVLILPFLVLLPPQLAPLVAMVACLAVVSEVAGLAALHFGASRRYDGPMGKSDRAFVLGVIGIGIGLAPTLAIPLIPAVLGLMAALLTLTIIRRCQNAVKEVA